MPESPRHVSRLLSSLVLGLPVLWSVYSGAAPLAFEGDWIRFKVLPASEWKPVAADSVTLTIGPSSLRGSTTAIWWQMEVHQGGQLRFVIEVLSDKAPLTAEDGALGTVHIYRLRVRDRPALEFVRAEDGLAALPRFGFRDGLVPTPRSVKNRVGPFLATAAWLGQPLVAHAHGRNASWNELAPVRRLALDDDVLVGTARWFKDDGKGPGPDGEYRYVELEAEDYERMIDAGFNLFVVNDKHLEHVREKPVFFVKPTFGSEPYPELLYRANYWGTEMFVDEPASRMDAKDCRTLYDAVNLLRTRNVSYFQEPGQVRDGIARMIQKGGFSLGDWLPVQDHIPVWETYHESAFYQLQGGAAGIVHEGRYVLEHHNRDLQRILGPGAQMTAAQSLATCYAYLRGAARCFGVDWGTAIYGQCDYAIAHQAAIDAYERGARYIWMWTSDHDHHLPFVRQLETARVLRAHQKRHPRPDRQARIRTARVAIAVPEGYMGTGESMWWVNRFAAHRRNEYGVPYGDVVSEYWWQIYDLATRGIDFDCVVDDPQRISQAGYERVIRVRPDGTTDSPPAAMVAVAPALQLTLREQSATVAEASPERNVMASQLPVSAVRIDGAYEDWAGANWFDLTEKRMYLDAAQPWGGETDAAARAAFAYDAQALYVAVEVRDDLFAAPYDGDFIWNNDSVQIGLDPYLNGGSSGLYEFDDVELGLSLVDGVPYAHVWHQRFLQTDGALPDAQVAIHREDEYTRYEARLPFACLRPLQPAFPGLCGMCIVVNDTDGDLRKGALTWTSGLADGKYPSRWGTLTFAGADRLPQTATTCFFRPEATVLKAGQEAGFLLETQSAQDVRVQLQMRIRCGMRRTDAVARPLPVPRGRALYGVSFSTEGLPAGAYHAEFASVGTHGVMATQSVRFFIASSPAPTLSAGGEKTRVPFTIRQGE